MQRSSQAAARRSRFLPGWHGLAPAGVAGARLREQRAEEVVRGWGSGARSLRGRCRGEETKLLLDLGLEAAPAAARLSCKRGKWLQDGVQFPLAGTPTLCCFVGRLDLRAALPCVCFAEFAFPWCWWLCAK